MNSFSLLMLLYFFDSWLHNILSLVCLFMTIYGMYNNVITKRKGSVGWLAVFMFFCLSVALF